jgi:antitoxin (DNA-binding transcriptional repressor) of toxin-antitoxin stability system
VVKDGEIVGIISYSKPCATLVPDIHTDVLIHMDFITLALQDQLYN